MTKAERKATETAASGKTPAGAAADLGKATSLDGILAGAELETVYETTFDEPLRLLREAGLTDGGKEYVREPADDIDCVLEGPGEVTVKNGRMHFKSCTPSYPGRCAVTTDRWEIA